MTDEEIIAASQQAAYAQMLARGRTPEQITAARAALAAPAAPTVTRGEQEVAAWNSATRHLPQVTDAEAARITEAMAAKAAEQKAAQAAELDVAFRNFQAEVEIGRKTPGHLYYVDPLAPHETVMDSATGKMVSYNRRAKVEALLEKTETALIEQRLAAGLPAVPAPRKTPAQIAQERHAARGAPKATPSGDEIAPGESRAQFLARTSQT
jgi:hypothetical protein